MTRQRAFGLAILVAIYIVVAHVLPRPATVSVEGWRLTAIFFATIAGQMTQPLPGAVVVLVGLMMFVLVGGLTMNQALAGYGTSSAWLVLAAMLMSRVLTTVGWRGAWRSCSCAASARVRSASPTRSLMSDVTLATGIPSIMARSGGIVLPITRGIAELYDSRPGPTAGRLGRFLMTSLYQGSAVACAMFLTGQASNVLAVGLAAQFANVTITWSSWLIAGLAPGIASCVIVPLVVYRMMKPEITHTPGAAAYAREELTRMGRMNHRERVALVVCAGIVTAWMTTQLHGLDVTLVAFLGLAVLVATDVLRGPPRSWRRTPGMCSSGTAVCSPWARR